MNFDFSDDQNLLRDSLRKVLRKASPLAEARHCIEQRRSHHAGAWQALADLGATALMLPEDCGGIGLGALELCVAAEEVGRQLCPVPLASTCYLAVQGLLLGGSAPQQQRWLPLVAQGGAAALAAPLDEWHHVPDGLPVFDGGALHGSAPLVADGEVARWALVLAMTRTGQAVWVALDLGAQVQRRRLDTLDPSKPYAALQFDGAPGQALQACPDALALLQRVRDRAAILVAFEQLGGADAALEMAAAYARDRRAFGRAIGSYQGIKHKLADVYTAIQMARAHCWYGAWALAADAAAGAVPAAELAVAAAAARVSASQAFSLAAQENIQTHGGMGTTWEADCHLFYRRARQTAVMLGGITDWRERLARQLEQRLAA